MPRVGFEHTIPASMGAKTVHAFRPLGYRDRLIQYVPGLFARG
jgi:hypothetical protein